VCHVAYALRLNGSYHHIYQLIYCHAFSCVDRFISLHSPISVSHTRRRLHFDDIGAHSPAAAAAVPRYRLSRDPEFRDQFSHYRHRDDDSEDDGEDGGDDEDEDEDGGGGGYIDVNRFDFRRMFGLGASSSSTLSASASASDGGGATSFAPADVMRRQIILQLLARAGLLGGGASSSAAGATAEVDEDEDEEDEEDHSDDEDGQDGDDV
jgi:hypothetical protein